MYAINNIVSPYFLPVAYKICYVFHQYKNNASYGSKEVFVTGTLIKFERAKIII